MHTVAHDATWVQQICDAVGVKGLRQQLNVQTPDSSELLEWRKQLREEIGGMGFDDPDQAVDGSDAVEYLGKLYDDLGQMVAARASRYCVGRSPRPSIHLAARNALD